MQNWHFPKIDISVEGQKGRVKSPFNTQKIHETCKNVEHRLTKYTVIVWITSLLQIFHINVLQLLKSFLPHPSPDKF